MQISHAAPRLHLRGEIFRMQQSVSCFLQIAGFGRSLAIIITRGDMSPSLLETENIHCQCFWEIIITFQRSTLWCVPPLLLESFLSPLSQAFLFCPSGSLNRQIRIDNVGAAQSQACPPLSKYALIIAESEFLIPTIWIWIWLKQIKHHEGWHGLICASLVIASNLGISALIRTPEFAQGPLFDNTSHGQLKSLLRGASGLVFHLISNEFSCQHPKSQWLYDRSCLLKTAISHFTLDLPLTSH